MMFMRPIAALSLTAALAACGDTGLFGGREDRAGVSVAQPDGDTVRPEARPGGSGTRPPPGARRPEEFDTSTEAERVAALAPPAAATRELGRSVATLGDPAEPGFWMTTPLVEAVRQGRVTHPASGASVAVELRPSGAAPGSGSRLSLAAFRALGLALTDLPELIVSAE